MSEYVLLNLPDFILTKAPSFHCDAEASGVLSSCFHRGGEGITKSGELECQEKIDSTITFESVWSTIHEQHR